MLVDIGRLDDLSYINDAGDHHRHRRTDQAPNPRDEQTCWPPRRPLLRHVAGGGRDPSSAPPRHARVASLAHGDPASDLPAALLASGGSLVITGPNGEQVVEDARLLTGFLETALADDEMVTEIRVPKAGGVGLELPEVQPASARTGRSSAQSRDARPDPKVALVNMGSAPMRHSGVESGSLPVNAGAGAALGCG